MSRTQPDSPVAPDDRFRFGKNWSSFVTSVDETRIAASIDAMRSLLGDIPLDGATFLDIGSGSGLSSLAAHRQGATVTAFDYDQDSVDTTRALLGAEASSEPAWSVRQGSVLDTDLMRSLGEFDIVYSWGVLHHTGDMALALRNAAIPVRPGGALFVAIYNDQGVASRRWLAVKRRYVRSGAVTRALLLALALLYFYAPAALRWPFARLRARLSRRTASSGSGSGHPRRRGMNRWHDLVDWVGGYPFEVAKPEDIVHVYRDLGFALLRMNTVGGGLGCNEFVFVRDDTP